MVVEGGSKEEAMPVLPECIGLDYEDIRAMLAQKHQTVVSQDDPMLMVASILNVFLNELEKISQRHKFYLSNAVSSQISPLILNLEKRARVRLSLSNASETTMNRRLTG